MPDMRTLPAYRSFVPLGKHARLNGAIIWHGAQWAVTTGGLECLDGSYDIERRRLVERDHVGHGWEDHMAGKVWVDVAEFRVALAIAIDHHVRRKGSDLRGAPRTLPEGMRELVGRGQRE